MIVELNKKEFIKIIPTLNISKINSITLICYNNKLTLKKQKFHYKNSDEIIGYIEFLENLILNDCDVTFSKIKLNFIQKI